MTVTSPITRYLELERNDNKPETLFRLQKGWTLEFRSGTSLFGTQYKVFTNHPLRDGVGYRRTEFHVVPWTKSTESADETAFFAAVALRQAGSFEYYYEDEETHLRLGQGYFVVDPILKVPNDILTSQVLPLDSIVLQTVVTKLLGPLSEWEGRLLAAIDTGYNVIHFTPVQELGDSNSAFALADQLKVAPTIAKSMREVADKIKQLYTEHKILSIVDVVLNHTATSSPWLKDHPEAAYNLGNSPHLRSAYLLDYLLQQFSAEVEAGKWAGRGIPANITEGHQLDKIKHALWHEAFPKWRLHEFYLANTDKIVNEFRKEAQNYKPYDQRFEGLRELDLQVGGSYARFSASVDIEAARAFFHAPTLREANTAPESDQRIARATNSLREWLNYQNGKRYETLQSHLSAALNCIAGSIYYERLQHDGPHHGPVTSQFPLVARYFHSFENFTTFEDAEAASQDPKRNKFIMAHNGWVMSFDPLKNFAAEDCNVYLRRELIPWTDNVKLRYGTEPADCPYLWSRMRDYVTEMCTSFHGIRLDNAHSTPLVVAEFMLDAGRIVNPDLFVIAELFTGSEGRDNIFVNRLGITSLIREAGNANDSHDLGRQVHRFGGEPVGSLTPPLRARLRPCMAHALFYDQTHDNPSMIKKHSLSDILPTAAVISMSYCASGSTRGYDELVPFALDIVTEKRLYRTMVNKAQGPHQVDINSGILSVRQQLNKLHHFMADNGYSQIFVDQMDSNTMAITRHNPDNHSSYIAVIRNAFHTPSLDNFANAPYLRALEIEGTLEEIALEACLVLKGKTEFVDNPDFITGISDGFQLYVERNLNFSKSKMMPVDAETQKSSKKRELHFSYFPPGAVIVFKTHVGAAPAASLTKIRALLSDESVAQVTQICQSFTIPDFNRVLFRTGAEEHDDGLNGDVYSVPRLGALPYCGLQSFYTQLELIRIDNDLGNAFCENLRHGDWMMEYIVERLRHYPNTKKLAEWIEKRFIEVRALPRYVIPQYFDAVVTKVYDSVVQAALARCGPFVGNGSAFTKQLAICTYQLCGLVLSSKMPALAPTLAPPLPPKVTNPATGEIIDGTVSLSAGHPHFSVGWARNWGRDTFIAMRGLLLLTGQFQEARHIILGYAGCLRHGLIPNLLSEGTGARYNARDAVWWWLYSIQQYVTMAPEGDKIFMDVVSRIFEKDDDPPHKPGDANQPLHAVIQEALTRHVEGVNFRERNAGWNLDRDMCLEGFNNGIGIDMQTGFVYGGNPHNCGTWMDKMGSSERAGTKGKPATPRDGSAIELVALCKSTLDWLADMHRNQKYPDGGVKLKTNGGNEKAISFDSWSKLIQNNFEARFFVGDDAPSEFIRSDLVHVKPMYKDTYGSFHFWADYQFRPNLCVAMVVAPDMFDPTHAWNVLDVVQKRLLGPLGLKTLDAEDWAYDGNYDNSDESDNSKRAHGFNYHQGPEWVWLMGFFLRAKLIFAKKQNDPRIVKETARFVQSVLASHWSHIQKSEWKGLPELTNANGAHCRHSCETQSWSCSSIIEALYCLQETTDR